MSHSSLASGSSSHADDGAGYEPMVFYDCEMQAEQPVRRYDRCIIALSDDTWESIELSICVSVKLEIAGLDRRYAGEECPAWFKEVLKDVQATIQHLIKELNAKQQQLQAKDKAVQALEAKLKNENQGTFALVLLYLVMLIIIVVVVLNGKNT